MSVKVYFIANPLEAVESYPTSELEPGKLTVLLQEYCLLHEKDFPHLDHTAVFVDVNKTPKDPATWEPVPPDEWNSLEVPDNSEIRIVIAFGDQRVSGIISVVVGVVMIVAGFWTGAGTMVGIAMIAGGVASVIGGIMAFTAKTPKLGYGMSGVDDLSTSSATYSWESQGNQTDPSLPVPIIYGQHRVTPHLINAFVDQNVNLFYNQSWSAEPNAVEISTSGLVNVWRSYTSSSFGVRFTLTNPNSIYTDGSEASYYFQEDCPFKIEYSNDGGANYTTWGQINTRGLYGVDLGRAFAGTEEVQMTGIGSGQFYIRITCLSGSATQNIKYWSGVYHLINTDVNREDDTQYLNLLYGVCEGEIDGISGVEINGTPVESMSDVPTVHIRLGTNNQTAIPGFGEIKNYKSYGVSGGQVMSQGVSLTLLSDGSEVSAIEAHIKFGSLFRQDAATGRMMSSTSTVRFEYGRVGDTPTTWDVTVEGCSRSPIARYFRLPGNGYGTEGQWQLKVTKLSQDNTDPYISNDVIFMGMYEVQDKNLIYPNTALLGMRIKATAQLSGSIPKVSCLVRGKKMTGLSPLEYNVWSRNPADCLYDLCTNARYGLGNFIDAANINSTQWTEVSTYCDDILEGDHRFLLDLVIDGTASALDLIQKICTTFRGLPIYSEGTIQLKVDKSTDLPVQVFSMGNILKDSFTVAYGDKSRIPNVIECTFANGDRRYEMDTIQIRSTSTETAAEKEIKRSVSLLGITRPIQIIRIGKYLYNSGVYITKSIAFKTWQDAVHCQPGDLIKFQHQVPDWGTGGLLTDTTHTTTTITLDKDVTIAASTSYVVTGRIGDGITVETKAVDEATTTGGVYPWTGRIIKMAEAFTSAPQALSPWAFGVVNEEAVTYRITRIAKEQDFTVAINAVEYNASIYGETGFAEPVRSPSKVPDYFTPPPAVTELTLKESDSTFGVLVSYTIPTPRLNFDTAEIQYSTDNTFWHSFTRTKGSETVLVDTITPGTDVYIRVVSYNSRGVPCTTPPTSSIFVTGIAFRPNNVYGLQVKGEAYEPYFYTRDCELIWKWDAKAGQEGFLDHFRVQVQTTEGTLIREDTVKDRAYTYTYEMNKQDNGRAIPSFKVLVWAVSRMGHESLVPGRITATNPSPNIIQGLNYDFTGKDCIFWWEKSLEKDIDGYKLRITGAGGTFEYLLAPDVTDFVYTYDQNVSDNGTVGDPTLDLDFYVVDAFNQSSGVVEKSMINNAPADVTGLSAGPGFRSVLFEWTRSTETDHKAYTYRTKVNTDAWSAWTDTSSTFYNRVLSQAEITNHTVSAPVYFEVKDKDIFDQTSASAAAINDNAEDIDQIDLSGEIFQITPADSDSNTLTTLKVLYDGKLSSGGVAYTVPSGWKYIEFQFPVEHTFNHSLIWASTSINCYIGYSTDGSTWSFLKAEADHTLDSTFQLLEATNEADAQTNYWKTDITIDGEMAKANWAFMRQAKYVRIYFETSCIFYEFKHWIYVVADEIEAGTMHLAYGLTIASTDDDSNAVKMTTNGLDQYGSGINTVHLGNDGTFVFRNAISGARLLYTESGLYSFNSGGLNTVQVLNDGSFSFLSAASGARLAFGNSGLDFYNSGGDKTISFVASDGSFALTSAASNDRFSMTSISGLNSYNAVGTQKMHISTSGTFWFGAASGANSLTFDGSTLILNGQMIITGGSGIANLSDADMDNIDDGSTYKRTTSNEKIGAGRAYTGITISGNFIGAVDPATPAPTYGGAGLYVGSDYLGYYTGAAWNCYIASDGTFKFYGAAGHYLEWNGVSLNIRGALNADDISAGTVTGRTIQTSSSGQRIVISGAANEMYFYGDPGDGSNVQLASIGIKNVGSDYIIGYFGSTADTMTRVGLVAASHASIGLQATSFHTYGGWFNSEQSYGLVSNGSDGILTEGDNNGIEAYGSLWGAANGYGVWASCTGPSTGGIGVYGIGHQYGIHGVTISASEVAGYFQAAETGGTGCRADGAGYDFYAGGAGTNYGPFTGAHDGLVAKGFKYVAGDIVIDSQIYYKKNISNSICVNDLSSFPKDSRVVGVIVLVQPMTPDHCPACLQDVTHKLVEAKVQDPRRTSKKMISQVEKTMRVDGSELFPNYDWLIFNALGEGQVNVCKEGGNIQAGDYICSSSTPGKGMKQDDGIYRNYTIARARENCSWVAGDNSIKMIACIYLAG